MKLRFLLLSACACAFAAGGAIAATATTTFTVTASVAANCTITATAINFPAYDPVFANATTAAATTGTVSISCTKGLGPSIGLSAGSNPGAVAGVTRAMANGTNRLGYELFQPAAAPGNGAVWTDIGGANALNAGVSTSKASRSFTVQAQIPPGQDVAVGSYSDTVTATVNF
ncbi:MAG: spore coat U domain-containing protein [Myxococcales bacterium]